MKKIRSLFLLFLVALPLIAAMPEDVECFIVGGFNDGGGPICGVACTDGTFYPMPCDADIFQ